MYYFLSKKALAGHQDRLSYVGEVLHIDGRPTDILVVEDLVSRKTSTPQVSAPPVMEASATPQDIERGVRLLMDEISQAERILEIRTRNIGELSAKVGLDTSPHWSPPPHTQLATLRGVPVRVDTSLDRGVVRMRFAKGDDEWTKDYEL